MLKRTIATGPGKAARSVTLPPAEEAAQRAEWAVADVAGAKRRLIRGFTDAALVRIAVQVPEWNSIERVEFLVSIANMLGQPNAAQAAARDVYLYVSRTAIPAVRGLTTLVALNAVDPAAALPFGAGVPGWPPSP